MKNKLIFFFIVLSGIFVSLVYSQEIKENNHISEDKKQSKPAENKNKTNALKKPAGFIPSEKINADSSVSFPIDI